MRRDGASLVQDGSAELRMIERRVRGDGTVGYRAHVRRVMEPGSPPRSVSRTFDKLRDAEEWHAEHDHRLIRERAGLSVPVSRARLSELATHYLDAKHAKPYATSKDRRWHLKWWIDYLGDPMAARVRGSHVRRGLDALSCGPKTQNRYLSSLSSVYRWAIRADFLESNPCVGVERESEAGHVVRFLSDPEREALGAAVEKEPASFRAFYLVSLWTGARLSEVLGLRWRDVDTTAKTIAYPSTKGGWARTVPVEQPVLRALAALGKHAPDERVFSHFSRKSWSRALEASKVKTFRWHDLRHSFCSLLVQRGVPLADVQQMAGHKAIATTTRYGHIAPTDAHERVRAAINQHGAASKKKRRKASPTPEPPSPPAPGLPGEDSPPPTPQP